MTKTDQLIITGILVLIGKNWKYYEVRLGENRQN